MKTPARTDRLDALGVPRPHPSGLTEGILQRAQLVPLPGRYSVTDAGGRGSVPGLFVRIGQGRPGPKGELVAGPTTFMVQLRVRGGGKSTLRQIRLGPAAIGLDRARELAREELRKAAGGLDPVQARKAAAQAASKAQTFRQYVTGDYRRHLDGLKTRRELTARVRNLADMPASAVDKLGDLRLGEVTAAHLDYLLRARKAAGMAAGTLHRDWRVLCAALRQAWKDDFLDVLPWKETPPALKGQRPNERLRWLGKDAPEEIKRFERALAEEDEDLRTAIKLLILTGARRNELLGLQSSEVSWERGCATLGPSRSKTGRTRTIVLNAEAQRLLRGLKLRDVDGAFFPGAPHAWRERLRKVWKRVRRKAKLGDMQLRDLRHTFAARLRLSGASLEVTRDALGHAKISMTERYSNISKTELRDAVAKVTS